MEPELRNKAWSQSSKQPQKESITVKPELVYTLEESPKPDPVGSAGILRKARDTRGQGLPLAGPQEHRFHLFTWGSSNLMNAYYDLCESDVLFHNSKKQRAGGATRAGNREEEAISRPAPVRTPATMEQQLRWALSPGEPAEPPVPGGQMGPGPGLRIPAGLRGQDGESRTRGAFLGLQSQKASSGTPGLL